MRRLELTPWLEKQEVIKKIQSVIVVVIPQKLREHLKRKNPCKLLQKQKEVASIQTPIQVPIQKVNQQATQASEIKA